MAGYRGLAVAEGERVDVPMPVYRWTVAGNQAPTGTEPAQALAVGRRRSTRRTPSTASCAARRREPAAERRRRHRSTIVALAIGRDAEVNVDPGQSITLNSAGQLTIDGRLNAWGGRIGLVSLAPSGGAGNEAYAAPPPLHLDRRSRDARCGGSGGTAQDSQGRRYGAVSGGGAIAVGGQIDPDTGKATSVDAFVVVRPGAVLEASGAQASFDTADGDAVAAFEQWRQHCVQFVQRPVPGRNDPRGIRRRRRGGRFAVGGAEAPLYKLGVPIDDLVLLPRELILGQHARDEQLAGDLQAGQADDGFIYGRGYLDVDRIEAGGFDNLFPRAANMLSFDGDVSLDLGQSLRISTSALALSDGSAEGARVHLAAPYVRLGAAGGSFEGVVSSVSQQPTQARFDLSADLIDIADNVTFGISARLPRASGDTLTVDRRGFDTVTLASRGDIRFLPGTDTGNGPGITRLTTAGDMDLLAAQLYPATGAVAQAIAGYIGGALGYAPGRVLTIGRSTDTEPAVPYSVFGFLTLGAEVIDQGGVARAPLGLLEFGTLAQDGVTRTINFLPGGITSVSAAGLVMPYGGTVDGIAYDYAGKPITLLGAGGTDTQGGLGIGINTLASSVYVEPDAVLDLSGGGELAGAGFISGRGGSTDARYNPLVQIMPTAVDSRCRAWVPIRYTRSCRVCRQAMRRWPPEGGAVDPMVGQQITLGQGVPGLPAGTYTLMPSTYALLPGAFRVELNGLAAQGASSRAAQCVTVHGLPPPGWVLPTPGSATVCSARPS